jgi:hypothetical protein
MSRQNKMRNKRAKDGKHSAGRTEPKHGKTRRLPYGESRKVRAQS